MAWRRARHTLPGVMCGLPRSLLLAICAAGLAVAAEPALTDLRVGIEVRPQPFRYELRDGQDVRSGQDAWVRATAVTAGGRWGLGWAASPHAVILGGDLLASDERTGDGRRRGWWLRAALGYGYGLHPRLALVGEAGLAAGRLDQDLGGAGVARFAIDGWGTEASLSARLRWRVLRPLALDGGVGWLRGRDRLSGSGLALDTDRSGLLWTLAAAWIIDPSPHPLER
ncbi:MAG: hypothetical protein L6R48_21590 [Planctomycetes bacterium]|nr:hypothetical protein [Planctomycetota bacterium]